MFQFDPFSVASLLVTTLFLSAFIVARYVLIAGLIYWLLWVRTDNPMRAQRLTETQPPGRLIRHEIRWSVISSFIYAFFGALTFDAWRSGTTLVYLDISDYGWGYLFISLPICLFIHDTWFYWTHRAMHHRRLFPIMHKVHHESRQPTPWAGFSFHPWESLVGSVILPVIVFIVPMHVGVVVAMLIIMTLTGIANHAGFEILPCSWVRGFIGRHWISATHHNLHHQNYRSNFALYFRFWDRVMGTDEWPADGVKLRSSRTVNET